MSFRPEAGEGGLRGLARRVLPQRARAPVSGLMRRIGAATQRADMGVRRTEAAAQCAEGEAWRRRHDQFDERLAEASRMLDTLELHGRVDALLTWMQHRPPPGEVRVSVITATYNRRALLDQALESVRAQSHGNWEHVVIDDGSTDGTGQFLAGLDDERLTVLRSDHRGLGAARNAGLTAATGSIIVYLDDDNVMHPHWLRAVVWAFSRLDDVDFLYGGRLVEDWSARMGAPSGEMPRLELRPYDRVAHERENIIDANVMAHRAGIAEARFAEDMQGIEDWDLGLRLAGRYTPLALPAVACLYSTMTMNRLCDTDRLKDAIRRLRSTVHTTRSMRVVVYATDPNDTQRRAVRRDVDQLTAGGCEATICVETG
ncbi:MAG: glycosyltransferase family 2 protein, partial [Candidatus Dormibacteria bacterium]